MCFILFGIYQGKTSKALLTKFFGFSILMVESGSMMPNLKIEEAILIKEQKEYDIGDCITYRIENKYLTTHRIVNKTEEGYQTKGDNNNTEDEKIVKKEQIQGKVIYHSEALGYFIKYYKWIILILFFLFVIVI